MAHACERAPLISSKVGENMGLSWKRRLPIRCRVAQKSWKLLAKSRAEFQRQYREQAKKPAVAAPVSVLQAKCLSSLSDAVRVSYPHPRPLLVQPYY